MSSSSSSLLVLLVGIILPLFVARCFFRMPPQARLKRAMVGCCLCLSAALFVIIHRPAIVDDCVAGRRPPAAGASRRSCVLFCRRPAPSSIFGRGRPRFRHRRRGRQCVFDIPVPAVPGILPLSTSSILVTHSHKSLHRSHRTTHSWHSQNFHCQWE
jgi:hypothetical protein